MIPVYVMSSHAYNRLLPGFAMLFNKFWSALQTVVVVTDSIPKGLPLPENFIVKSISNGRPTPKSAWSDGLISAISHCPASHLVLLLSDYYLIRSVDDGAVPTLSEFASLHPEILRVDLTDDRQFNGEAFSIGTFGQYDMVETPCTSPYQASLQAGIWSRDNLLSVLRPSLTPWQVELQTDLASRPDLRVVGTKNAPVRYANISTGGDDRQRFNYDGIPAEHREYMSKMGWLP